MLLLFDNREIPYKYSRGKGVETLTAKGRAGGAKNPGRPGRFGKGLDFPQALTYYY
jgi:hypothetical protein